MTTDVLNVDSNERVDLEDFLFAVDESLRANVRQIGEQFLSDPARTPRSWVLSGFAPSSDLPGQVTVTRGRAILAQREVGQVYYGAVASEGDLTKIVDVSSYADGTYGIYVRLELIDAETESRAFWEPTGLGSEIAQTLPTRRAANWSVRIEMTLPGAEWMQVGTVDVLSGVVDDLVDTRDFYFEGATNTYLSGWSTDGGGGSMDRSASRDEYGAHDLHTFLAAMRQCLEDIKGRGLRRWWARDIGGMNIGFDAAPVEDCLAVGDANFNLTMSAGVAYLYFDTNDYMRYQRTGNEWDLRIGGATKLYQSTLLTQIAVDTNINGGGLAVGYEADDTEIAVGEVTVLDADFGMVGHATDPKLYFDRTNGDYLSFDRSLNALSFNIGSTAEMTLKSTGLTITNGLDVGFSGTVADDAVRVGDQYFNLTYSATYPALTFAANDAFQYDRTNNEFEWLIGGGTAKAVLSATALDLITGLNMQADNYRWTGAATKTLDVWVGRAGSQLYGNAAVGSGGIITFTGGGLYIPILWPKGARITRVKAYMNGGAGETTYAILTSQLWNGSTTADLATAMGGAGLTEADSGAVNLSRSDNYFYHLAISNSPGSAECDFRGAEITFAFDEVPVKNWSL
jgi:hypothetical protein